MARDARAVEAIARSVGLTVWPSFIAAACSTAKIVYILGGWRGGKSARIAFIIFVRIILKWLHVEGTHLVWLIGPDYEQARPEYFYLSRWCTALGMQVNASTAIQGSLRMEISLPGMPGRMEVVTKSATDPTSLGSVAPVEIAMCEAGQISEEADLWIDGRTAEKNANVIKGGTFENDDGNPQYEWFEVQALDALKRNSERVAAFTCPTWENMYLYGDCRPMLADDPSLAAWCPDDQHGPLHSGLGHPMIRQLKDRWKDRPRDWRKRFGGEPVGIRNPIYEWALADSLEDFEGNVYLVSMSKAQERLGQFRWLKTAGGMDFGVVHPSAITMASVNQLGHTWVRRCEQDESGSLNWIWLTARQWSQKYRIPNNMWMRDPMVKYAPTYLEGEAVSGSMYAREARVGLVNSLQQDRVLFFDSDDLGVKLLFGQIRRVHWKSAANGKVVYDREKDDDMVASFEDCMVALHGQPVLKVQRSVRIPKLPVRQYANARSVS